MTSRCRPLIKFLKKENLINGRPPERNAILLEATMHTKGYSRIPSELFDWITFLTQALPIRSVKTFIELLIGVMLTRSGFVCDTYLKVKMRNHWGSYFKWLKEGKWSWLRLAQRFTQLALKQHNESVVHLVIDDTLTLRASKKAPACKIHHQHGNKPNLAGYVLGQCWVSLAMIVTRPDKQSIAIPLIMRLMPSSGNTGKLVGAKTLFRALKTALKTNKPCRVLLDSWFMRGTLIKDLLKQDYTVIGQVRRDTRLYEKPETRNKPSRGRPRKFGKVIDWDIVKYRPIEKLKLVLYGKEQIVHCRSQILMARFLDGRQVNALWCELEDKDGNKRPYRLFLCTDTSLTAEEILLSYAKRWAIESMFHQLKHDWGMKEMWQQTRQVLHRWIQITQVAYGLTQLLSILKLSATKELGSYSPWRNKMPMTAGRIREGLTRELMHVRVADWWNGKMKIFRPPDEVISS